MGDHQGFLEPKKGFSTLAIHVGQDPEKWKSAAVVPPIVTSTTFKQPAPAEHTVRLNYEPNNFNYSIFLIFSK